MSKILALKILKKYHLVKEVQNQLGFSAKMMRKNSKRPAGLHFYRKPHRNIISVDTTEKIKIFLERDDNSSNNREKGDTHPTEDEKPEAFSK